MPKDKYTCQLCQNHGLFDVPKKGHKQNCPFKACTCPRCILNTRRRELDQKERLLRKDGDEATSSASPSDSRQSPLKPTETAAVDPPQDKRRSGSPPPLPPIPGFRSYGGSASPYQRPQPQHHFLFNPANALFLQQLQLPKMSTLASLPSPLVAPPPASIFCSAELLAAKADDDEA